jgi:threonylcarbamoyladenosine tRNA methylthiotransferase MtaB
LSDTLTKPSTIPPVRVAIETLGCRLNQFESDSLATRFLAAGYQMVNYVDDADVYIVNTCTVTNKADRKSRNLLSRAQRRQIPILAQPHAEAVEPPIKPATKAPLVVATGCYAEHQR